MMGYRDINSGIKTNVFSVHCEAQKEQIFSICRNFANGKPYISTLEMISSSVIKFRSLTVYVFESEVSMTLEGIRMDGGLGFYGQNLPDLVN